MRVQKQVSSGQSDIGLTNLELNAVGFSPEDLDGLTVTTNVNQGSVSTLSTSVAASTARPDLSADSTTTATLNLDSLFGSVINFAGDVDWFRLEVDANENVRFSVIGNNGFGGNFDIDLQLIDDEGNIIAEVDGADPTNVTNASGLNFTFADAGTYFLAVSADDDNVTGNYSIGTLTVQDIPGDEAGNSLGTAGVVPADGVINGAIQVNGDSDWYAFNVSAGDIVEAFIDSNSTHRHNLRIVDENGTVLPFGTGFNFSEQLNSIEFRAAEDMTVFLQIRSSFPDDYSIDTRVTTGDLANDTSTTGTLILDGSPVESNLFNSSDKDWFAIELDDSGNILVEVFGIDGNLSFVDIELFDEEGRSVGTWQSHVVGQSSLLNIHAAEAGTYYVQIETAGDLEGDYQVRALSVEDDFGVTPADRGVINLDGDSDVAGSLESSGDEDQFTFFADANEVVHFIVNYDVDRGFIRPAVFDAAGNPVQPSFLRQEDFGIQAIFQLDVAGEYAFEVSGGSTADGDALDYQFLPIGIDTFDVPPAFDLFFQFESPNGANFLPINLPWAALPGIGNTPTIPESDSIEIDPDRNSESPAREDPVDITVDAGETLFFDATSFRLDHADTGISSRIDISSGQPVTLTNDGTIWAQSRALGRPAINGDFLQITNNGEIVALTTTAIANAIGGGSGSLLNSGTITAFSRSNMAVGYDITEPSFTRDLDTNAITLSPALINTGTISAWAGAGASFLPGGGGATAVRVLRGGISAEETLIENSGTISAQGFDSASGLTLGGGSHKVVNSGLIFAETSAGDGNRSIGIDGKGGATIDLVNTGTISAEIALFLGGATQL